MTQIPFSPRRQARRRRSVAHRFGDRCLMCGAGGVPFTLALVLQSASTAKEERRAGFSALCDLRGELFVAGLPEEDA